MNIEISDELIIEGIARATERILSSDELVNRIADAICERLELLDAGEAAAVLGVTTRTLSDRHVDWGLDKSVAFGATSPRYFLSQIIARAHERVIVGRKG